MKDSKLDAVATGEEVTLREVMKKTVESGQIKIIPEQFEKIYFHWIENLRDWCISRQIWYGHRVPVWYRHRRRDAEQTQKDAEEIYVGIEAPNGDGWRQDPDTLDTWFSSGLWTFSTLGWPLDDARGKPTLFSDGTVNPESDLGIYHPTTLLETGYDILFFWVARMILMSGYHLGDIPFKTVYLHGLVRDTKGQKMSKTLGNVIDPLDMTHKYGADATRLSLIVGISPGSDLRLSEDKVRGYKHFANKIWNIARFVLSNTEGLGHSEKHSLNDNDKKLLEELENVQAEVTADLTNFRLHLAAEKLYHYLWHRFADVILEESKPILSGSNEKEKASRQTFLYEAFITCLKLLHPFMPFVTEEIWSHLPATSRVNGPKKDSELLMVTKWPVK